MYPHHMKCQPACGNLRFVDWVGDGGDHGLSRGRSFFSIFSFIEESFMEVRGQMAFQNRNESIGCAIRIFQARWDNNTGVRVNKR